MRRTPSIIATFAGMSVWAGVVQAAAITNGNLVVVRINGTGGGAAASFLEEYTTTGTLVQSIPMPTVDGAGGNQTCTLPGNATTNEGYLSMSTNGQYLTMACNDAAIGTGVTVGTHDRVVARVDLSGNVDTTTRFNLAGGYNTRSAVMDGNNIWVAGSANNKAIIHTTFGSSSGTVITNLTNGPHVAKIYNGQLYATIDPNTGNPQGVFTVGSGLPTAPGQSATLMAGSSINADIDAWDLWFADPSTVYFNDSRAIASGGGIQKWAFNGSAWIKQYTLNSGLTNGLFGLTGVVNGGIVTMFATTADNKLVSVTDTGAASNFDTILTGVSGSVFRGIVLTTPEPASLALLVLGGLTLIRRRCGR